MFEAYLERHGANDLEGVLALFGEDPWVEDPVGSPVHRGIDAIREFYAGTHRRNGPIDFERLGAPLVGGDEIAAHVRAGLRKPGSPPAMDVIYTIRLDGAGRIASLRAWY